MCWSAAGPEHLHCWPALGARRHRTRENGPQTRRAAMIFRVRHLWWLARPPGLIVANFVFFIMPFEPVGRPSVVVQGELSCGQVMLTQTFTGTTDPYLVDFY